MELGGLERCFRSLTALQRLALRGGVMCEQEEQLQGLLGLTVRRQCLTCCRVEQTKCLAKAVARQRVGQLQNTRFRKAEHWKGSSALEWYRFGKAAVRQMQTQMRCTHALDYAAFAASGCPYLYSKHPAAVTLHPAP